MSTSQEQPVSSGQPGDDWPDVEQVDRTSSDPQLTVDLDGYEGPLDLLLALARSQKVDLANISILQLVEQYLAFIDDLKRLRLELAADYLVMAAWLAYLKSRLLLPPPEVEDDGPTGEELAQILAFRLRRLEAMRERGAQLMNRNRLGRDVFGRGDPEPITIDRRNEFSATMYELLSAYSAARERTAIIVHAVEKREVWSLSDARDILERLIGKLDDWAPLEAFILQYVPDAKARRSALASAFAASLELVREGHLELRQDGAYAPINLRSAAPKPALDAAGA
ncbi:MAG: ScpA family protein [Pseudomonadota bacterium]